MKKTFLTIGILASAVAVLVLIAFSSPQHVRALADGELFGYVCNVPAARNIGCISLDNAYTIPAYRSPSGHQVTFDRSSQLLSGRGWSPRVGYVDFGLACPSEIVSAVGSRASGNKCARAESSLGSGAAGWNGWLYVGDVSYNPGISTPRRDSLSGYGWESWNIDNLSRPGRDDVGMGWIDFSTAKIAILGCTDPADTVHYDPNATVDDGSCNPSVVICVPPQVYDPITGICVNPPSGGIKPIYKEN